MQKNTLLREWNGKEIRQRADGWLSLTDMASACGKKFADWQKLDGTKSYVAYAEDVMQICITEVNQGGFDQGTWGHPRVAIKFACWLSVPFEFQVTSWIEELVTEGGVNIKEAPIVDANAAITADLLRDVLKAFSASHDRPVQRRELDSEEMRLRSLRKEYADAISNMRMTGEHVSGTERSLHQFYQTRIKQFSKGELLALADDVWVEIAISGKGLTAVNLTRFERQLSDYRYIASREAAAIFDQKDLWYPRPFTTRSVGTMLTRCGWVHVSETNAKVPGRRKQSACHDHYWMRSVDVHLLRDGLLEPLDLDLLDFAYQNMNQEATCCSVSTQAIQMAWNTSHLGKQIYLTGQKCARALRRLGFTPHSRDSGAEKDSFWDFPNDQ